VDRRERKKRGKEMRTWEGRGEGRGGRGRVCPLCNEEKGKVGGYGVL